MRRAAAMAVILPALVACSVELQHVPGYRCDDGVTCPSGQMCVGGQCMEMASPDGAGLSDGSTIDSPPGFSPPWWDDAWGMRAPLTVGNRAAAPLPAGFAVRWFFDLTPYAPPPFYDVRIARWDGEGWTEKPRVLDDFPDMTPLEEQVWFTLDAELAAGASTTEYWVYWSNASAGAPPVASPQVFPLFYDGFETAALDTTRWEVSATTIDASSGDLILDPGEAVRSLVTFGPGHAIDVQHSRTAAAADSWSGFQRSADLINMEPWALWIDWTGTGTLTPDSRFDAIGDTGPVTGPSVTPGTSAHFYTIERYDDHIVFFYDGAEIYRRTLPSPYVDPLQIKLRNGSGAAVLAWEFVRIRLAADPEPTVAAGAMEARP